MQNYLEMIRHQLAKPLPGSASHLRMMNLRRTNAAEARTMVPPPRESAVLMVLFPRAGHLHTVFTLRPSYDGVHSGQVSFPGGKMEPDDPSAQATALRETEEEIGIRASSVQILGALSELYIPPSHFVVQPYVGFVEEEPEFSPDPKEVEKLIIEPLSVLFRGDAVRTGPVYIEALGREVQTSYFTLGGQVVWGATAMMLMEFVEAMGGVGPELRI